MKYSTDKPTLIPVGCLDRDSFNHLFRVCVYTMKYAYLILGKTYSPTDIGDAAMYSVDNNSFYDHPRGAFLVYKRFAIYVIDVSMFTESKLSVLALPVEFSLRTPNVLVTLLANVLNVATEFLRNSIRINITDKELAIDYINNRKYIRYTKKCDYEIRKIDQQAYISSSHDLYKYHADYWKDRCDYIPMEHKDSIEDIYLCDVSSDLIHLGFYDKDTGKLCGTTSCQVNKKTNGIKWLQTKCLWSEDQVRERFGHYVLEQTFKYMLYNGNFDYFDLGLSAPYKIKEYCSNDFGLTRMISELNLVHTHN